MSSTGKLRSARKRAFTDPVPVNKPCLAVFDPDVVEALSAVHGYKSDSDAHRQNPNPQDPNAQKLAYAGQRETNKDYSQKRG